MTQVNVQEVYANMERIMTDVIRKELPKAMLRAASEYLTAEEVGLYLKVSRDWVYKRIHVQRNPIPHYDMDGTYRFRWPEVEEWAKKGRLGK